MSESSRIPTVRNPAERNTPPASGKERELSPILRLKNQYEAHPSELQC